MLRSFLGFSLAAMLAIFAPAAFAATADADGDGLSDACEEILGTDPAAADRFRLVIDDGPESEDRRARDSYDPTKDVLSIEFCHAGEDRYLWRATFAAEPHLEDTVFHLYVDADADETTGREGPAGVAHTGTEYMLTVAGGVGRSTVYDAEGNVTSGPPVTHLVQGKTLLVSADVQLGRDSEGIRYDLHVLCHTITEGGGPVRMSDSTGKRPIRGIPPVDRPKIMRPGDFQENYRVEATFGRDVIRGVLRDEDTIVVPHDGLETDGFEVDQFTSRRWPHVSRTRPDGKVWTRAPKAGRFHVGFLMYDDGNDERVAFYVDGQFRGLAAARQDNDRTWLFWLAEPIDLQGGERIELRAVGSGGKHGIVNIVFLPRPPEVRRVESRVENMAARPDFDRPGRVIVSWTTTLPCPTRLEYGRSGEPRDTLVEQEDRCLAHRVVLESLDPRAKYHGRALAVAPDGSEVAGSDVEFPASSPLEPVTRAGVHEVPLAVPNARGTAVERWPATSGIPFPQGELGSPGNVRLVRGKTPQPLQTRILGRWPDGSVKWLLLTFFADAPADGSGKYVLQYGRDVKPTTIENPVAVARDDAGVAIDTGPLQFRIDRHGNLVDLSRGDRRLISADAACETIAVDAEGKPYTTRDSNAEITVEEDGPLRAVVKVASHLSGPEGGKLLRIEKRIEAYRGVAWLRVHHTLVVEREPTFTELDGLSYRVPVPAEGRAWQVALADGSSLTLDGSRPSVRQQFDRELVVSTPGGEEKLPGRAVGSIVTGGQDGCAVAVRDFWQNYPKGFTVTADGIDVDLCPEFDPGLYDAFPFEKEGHHLYFYLLDGRYKLKRGVAKTHELLLCLEPEGRREEVCRLFQEPPTASAPPAWYCGSKALYSMAPRDAEKFALYEAAIDKNLAAYADRRELRHDYGLLNYGDWYGERGTNWGNVEYDTQHAFFLQYVRSGNPAALALGLATELHNRDVDTVHWDADPAKLGAVYVHQMCHVGDYYDRGVPGSLGFPHGGFTVSHAWVEGHFEHYFLTGDRRSFDTGCAVADFFVRKELGGPYDFLSCRTPGWHLIMLAAAYHATGDPYYLNAAKVVVRRVLEAQDTEPRPLPAYQAKGRQPYQLGGWSRMMVPGHCQCEPRHRGNAGFMVAILLSGLKYYHDITGDPEVKEAIIRGAHYLLDECYSEEVHGFRYTSCPNTRYSPGATPLMVEGIARAYVWTGDERFRRVLTEALPLSAHGSAYGKSFSMDYRCGPRVLADLEAAGISLNRKD